MRMERDTELKILKRERDEYLTSKMELIIESKKLKVIVALYILILCS